MTQTSGFVESAENRPLLGSDPLHSRRSWTLLGVIILGSYLTVIDNAVLGIALPNIAADFASDDSSRVDWVITANLLASAVTLPGVAWMVSRWGAKATYVRSLVLFTSASALCVVAPSMWVLVVLRGIQGLGGAAIMPVGMAMLFQAIAPTRRGAMMGIWGICIMAAPTLGAPLGGSIVAHAGWRWIFGSYLPLGVLAITVAVVFLRDPVRGERRPLDLLGWAVATAAVAMLVIGARQAGSWGFTSPATLAVLAVGLGAATAFVVRCLHQEHPLIEVRVFAVPAFAISVVIISFVYVAQFSRQVFLPIELQVVRGLDAGRVGLLMAPAALGIAVVLPVAGWITDRIGPRVPVIFGLLTLDVGVWRLAHTSLTTSDWELAMNLVIAGIGTGMVFTPNMVAAMNALPRRFVPHASSITQLNRQVCGALTTAGLGAIVAGQLGDVAPVLVRTEESLAKAQEAYNDVFLVAATALLVSIALALALPGRQRSAAYQHDRLAEHEQALAG